MDKIRCAILCVDDDPIILQMLQFQLKKHLDIECVIMEFFTNPSEVLEIIDETLEESIELIFVIVDFKMPEMSGADLITKIKSLKPETKFIILSGQANDIIVNQLKSKNSLEAFILKPWDEKELMDLILPILKEKNIL